MTDQVDADTREQIAKQCDVVRHMATVLAGVHEDYAKIYRDPRCATPADHMAAIVGPRTARFMQVLGDMLNGMDAVSEEDRWIGPILAEAQRRWPTKAEIR